MDSTWYPDNDNSPSFQNLMQGQEMIGQITYDGEAGVWRAFRPVGRPVGFSSEKSVARKIVENSK